MRQPNFTCDMHFHSHWSDGDLSVQELVKRGRLAGLKAMVLTDHASTGGWEECRVACATNGILTFPAAETTAYYDGIWFDISIYGINPTSDEIVQILSNHKTALVMVRNEYINWLRVQNIEIDWPMIATRYRLPDAGAHSLYFVNKYRREIYETDSQIISADIKKAGLRIIDRAKFYRNRLSHIGDIVKVVGGMGGIVSLLHPTKSATMISRLTGDSKRKCLKQLLNIVKRFGIHAIEVRHPGNSRDDTSLLTTFVRDHKVMVTGGSDYHGDQHGEHKPNAPFGIFGLTLKELEECQKKFYL